MPSSPAAQEAGAAIPIGIVAVILLLLSGTFSLSYRLPVTANTITKFWQDKSPPRAVSEQEHSQDIMMASQVIFIGKELQNLALVYSSHTILLYEPAELPS